MYRLVLIAHGDWRWAVLIAGFAAVLNAALGLGRRRPWEPLGPRLGKYFSMTVDIQVLLGAALYLVLSPLTNVVFSVAGAQTRGSDVYFFSVIHPAVMTGGFIAVHVSSVLVRRGRSDAARQRRAVMFYGITLLLILSAIPWWRPLGRI